MHMLRRTDKLFYQSNFERVPSVHLMNNAWVDNFNSCLKRSITHKWAPRVSSPMFFIHTHKVPCPLKQILHRALGNIVGCKKKPVTHCWLVPGKQFTEHRPSQFGCSKTEKKSLHFISFTLGQWATQKQKALDIFSTLCPNHLKSAEFSDKHFVVRLGMIYIHEALTQMMRFLSNLHVFGKDLRCNTFSRVKSCFEIRKAGCYFVQCRTYNIKASREVAPLLRTACQHTSISKYFALQKPNF